MWTAVVLLGTIIGSSLITHAGLRNHWNAIAAVVIGGLLPGIFIFGYCFYLETQQPVGPYYAVWGVVFGAASAVLGIIAAAVTALLCHWAKSKPVENPE